MTTTTTSPKTLSFTCALITGGGSGIGKATAEHFLSTNKKVIIVGRTEEELEKTARELGIQRPFNIPTGISLPKATQEININILGPLHLTTLLLPHFKTKPNGAVIMNVSSILGFILFSVINPVYNGTKAWLHSWSLNLRTQLENDKETERIAVVEIVPPTVETELHRERDDPTDNKKANNPDALSVEDFMADLRSGLEAGRETIGAGVSSGVVERWEREFGTQYLEEVENARTKK